LVGWREGFSKLAFTKLLQDRLGYELGMAHSLTDGFVDGSVLTVKVEDPESFKEEVRALKGIVKGDPDR
jgi:hypothetical protein